MSAPHPSVHPPRALQPVALVTLVLALSACGGGSGGDATTAPAGAVAPRLVVSPRANTVPVGASLGFTATLTDAQGRPVGGAPVAWRSSTPSVATVDAGGTATGRAPGQTVIVALLDGVPRDSAMLTVVESGTGIGQGPGTGTPSTGTPSTGTPGTGTPSTGTPGTGTPGTQPPGTGTPADTLVVPGPATPSADLRCGGIAQLRLVTGSAGFTYAHTRTVAQVAYNLDSSGDLSFALPRTGRGPDGVTWSGVVSSGRVKIRDVRTDREYDPPHVTKLEGDGVAEREFYGEPASAVTVSVDLRRCTYTLSFTAAVVTRADDVEGTLHVAAFTSPSLRWESRNSYSVVAPVHSALWATTGARSGPYFVSGGFAAELFLMGSGNDVMGEGGATVTFSFSGER